MKKVLKTIAILLGVSTVAMTQTISPMAVVSGGLSSSSASGYTSYTVGQAVVIGGSAAGLSDGFQQSWGVDTTQNNRVQIKLGSLLETQPGDYVRFTSNLVTTDGAFKWTFAGIPTKDSVNTKDFSPSFIVDKPGSYTAVLALETSPGKWEKSAPLVFKVLGITQKDTTVCVGSKLSLQTNATSNIVWDNDITGLVNNVTVTKTTNYTVTINGTLKDTVKISVYAPIVLGKDTALCVGKSLNFDFTGKFDICKWNGESLNKLSNSFSEPGKVKVAATDANGCKTYDSLIIKPSLPLPVVGLGNDTAICDKKTLTLKVNDGVSYKWSDNSTANQLTVDKAGTYQVTVTGANGCTNSDAIMVSILKPYQEQIGVVTVDSASKKVVIAWNKHQNKRTERYIVLRESATAGIWDTVGKRTVVDSAYVFDKTADFEIQAYKYKLRTYDSVCKNYAESDEHRTMHVRTSKSGTANWINVDWNAYIGFGSALKTYNVHRYWANGKDSIVNSQASNGSADMSFTDKKPINGAQYRVLYDIPEKVYPALFKTDTGPFSQSMSNMSEASVVSSTESLLDEVAIFPNPTNSVITITANDAEGAQVFLVTNNGEVLTQTTILNGVAQFSVENVAKGIYTVQLQTNNGSVSESVTVQ